MASRELVNIILFNGQALFSNRLFDPETKDFAGKPLDKPSFSLNIRYPKTQPNWYDEPLLKPLADACKVVMTRDMPNTPFNYVEFPIKDGDRPNKQGKVPDWAKGHWYVRASSTFAPKVEQIVNGAQSELPSLQLGGKKLWNDGDFVCVALSIGKRLNDNVGIRCYLNSVLFTGKGAEISTGGAGVDWSAAMQLAHEQGISIEKSAGDAGNGFPGGGFPGAGGAPAGFPGAAPAGAPGGFNPGGAAPFNPGGTAAPGFGAGPTTAAPGGFPGAGQDFSKLPF
jgi:hypothetical protein